MALTDNLVSFWEFEEASGTRVDAKGTNDLADNNSVAQGTGKVGYCADFESSNSMYLSHASNADLQTGDIDWTIAGWINRESVTGFVDMMISRDDEASGNREYFIGVIGNKIVTSVFKATDSEVSLTANTFGVMSLATWYFIVVSHDASGDTLNAWVNLTGDSVGTGGALQAAGSAQFRVAAREYINEFAYFDGLIDQVGFWKRVLTSQERTDLYNGGAGLSYAAMGGGGGGGNPWYSYAQQRQPTRLSRRWERPGLLWTPAYSL